MDALKEQMQQMQSKIDQLEAQVVELEEVNAC